jgi:hypothetical protein
VLQQLRSEVGTVLQYFLSPETSLLPKEDYKEMIELCLLVANNDKQYHFCLPGAYHMVRRVIYCMKRRNEFKLPAKEK